MTYHSNRLYYVKTLNSVASEHVTKLEQLAFQLTEAETDTTPHYRSYQVQYHTVDKMNKMNFMWKYDLKCISVYYRYDSISDLGLMDDPSLEFLCVSHTL